MKLCIYKDFYFLHVKKKVLECIYFVYKGEYKNIDKSLRSYQRKVFLYPQYNLMKVVDYTIMNSIVLLIKQFVK